VAAEPRFRLGRDAVDRLVRARHGPGVWLEKEGFGLTPARRLIKSGQAFSRTFAIAA
jgi:hypothetical protein